MNQTASVLIAPRQQDIGRSASLNEAAFRRVLRLECRRAERTRRSLLLALVLETDSNGRQSDRFVYAIQKAEPSLRALIRETDICGWYEARTVYGIIFPECGDVPREVAQSRILEKINAALERSLDVETFGRLRVVLHFYPEPLVPDDSTPHVSMNCEDTGQKSAPKLSLVVKRCVDIAATLLSLILLLPVLAAIAIAIKIDSRGPVIFKQTRIGQRGRFNLLKFRSMSSDCDPTVHQQYVKRYISGGADATESSADGKQVYKLAQDQRVTRIGRILRRSSLDELPQLLNVLKGDMSLVGPRPPIPYELEAYDVWHMRRLVEAKPGITGLWQVRGRSRTSFDDMVRLDLRYAKNWSLWLDLKILCETPRAVFSGDGAY